MSGWLPCLATRFRLLGEQVLGWTMEGSSTDQVRGSSKVPGLLGILTNLFPSNNPSKSYPLLVTHASWSIQRERGEAYRESEQFISHQPNSALIVNTTRNPDSIPNKCYVHCGPNLSSPCLFMLPSNSGLRDCCQIITAFVISLFRKSERISLPRAPWLHCCTSLF